MLASKIVQLRPLSPDGIAERMRLYLGLSEAPGPELNRVEAETPSPQQSQILGPNSTSQTHRGRAHTPTPIASSNSTPPRSAIFSPDCSLKPTVQSIDQALTDSNPTTKFSPDPIASSWEASLLSRTSTYDEDPLWASTAISDAAAEAAAEAAFLAESAARREALFRPDDEWSDEGEWTDEPFRLGPFESEDEDEILCNDTVFSLQKEIFGDVVQAIKEDSFREAKMRIKVPGFRSEAVPDAYWKLRSEDGELAAMVAHREMILEEQGSEGSLSAVGVTTTPERGGITIWEDEEQSPPTSTPRSLRLSIAAGFIRISIGTADPRPTSQQGTRDPRLISLKTWSGGFSLTIPLGLYRWLLERGNAETAAQQEPGDTDRGLRTAAAWSGVRRNSRTLGTLETILEETIPEEEEQNGTALESA